MNKNHAASVTWIVGCTALAVCVGLIGDAAAEWTVSSLHPAGQLSSEARGGWGIYQVGNIYDGAERATLWSGTAASWVNLDPAGSSESMALGASATNQVGWADVAGRRRASLWSGTAASWVDLHPAGAFQSQALGAWGGNQVGFMSDGVGRASLWSGTAASWVDLHPVGVSQSEALAIWDDNQAGRVVVEGSFHAGMWSGTAESFVDLHPAGAFQSEARGIADGYQVGFADVNSTRRASLWSGTADSWVDLHPAGARSSLLHGAYGSIQVGEASVNFNDHASVWSGTPESWVDLHELLSPDFRYSYALSASSDGVNDYVAGLGYNVFEGRFEALLWTQPVSDLGCDFTGDELCDVTDIDLMQSLGPIAEGIPAAGNEAFDLNGDATHRPCRSRSMAGGCRHCQRPKFALQTW